MGEEASVNLSMLSEKRKSFEMDWINYEGVWLMRIGQGKEKKYPSGTLDHEHDNALNEVARYS